MSRHAQSLPIDVDHGPAAPVVRRRPALESDPRESRLFRSLDVDNDGLVSRRDLERALLESGLRLDDPRLAESLRAFAALEKPHRRADAGDPALPIADVSEALRPNITLIERALQGDLIVPDFEAFAADVDGLYRQALPNVDGDVARYIPQLALEGPDADRFGVALCTVDGQRRAFGDSDTWFSVQSASKPITYCLALEEHGVDGVHRYVGHEPSGVGFNELTLDRHNRPHNPLINAGAIMCSSLIALDEKRRIRSDGEDARGFEGERLDYVLDRWARLSGGREPRFGSSVYLSERQTADRNHALGYYMREKDAFPDGASLEDVLDFYFQTCSVEIDAQTMAVVAATLANGGVCPTTGERVLSTEAVKRCLSMMSSCGMYDYSGEFAFNVGLPAKSSVSGVVMIVVPNVMGICTWSPKLDKHGNSVRGLDFCHRLARTFNLHSFDNLRGVPGKKDPRVNNSRQEALEVVRLILAASKGDLGAIQRQITEGARLDCGDYDLRTPLHLAAAEGRMEVVKLFVDRHSTGEVDIDLDARDRWGGTPLDDAKFHGHDAIADLLESANARCGKVQRLARGGSGTHQSATIMDTEGTAEMIWAASVGDMLAIRRLVARGVPIDVCDYDLRTPLHLAAAEGHRGVVEYFLAHGIDPNPRDRWGNTPLSDALRHQREDVAAVMRDSGAGE